jgi:signal transduction histidine kinase
MWMPPAVLPPCPQQRARHAAAHLAEPEPDVRGLLHDLGHGLFTLSLLLESARGELLSSIGSDALDLVEQETSRLLAVLHSGVHRDHRPAVVELRALLEPFAVLAERTVLARVSLRPGPPVELAVDPGMIWRVVSNLLDNAVRAAGPLGNVDIAINRTFDGDRLDDGHDTVTIDIVDDGPGFQRGPRGTASLGLTVVASLLDECGGRLQIDDVEPHGTRMRVLLPASQPTHVDLGSGVPASRQPSEGSVG